MTYRAPLTKGSTKERKEQLLRACHKAPKTARELTHGTSMHADHILKYLTELCDAGFMYQEGEHFRSSAAGMASLRPVNLTPSICYGPLSTTGHYTTPRCYYRNDGHKHLPSRTAFIK